MHDSPPFIVSHYMPNGDVKSYLMKNPNANRVRLVRYERISLLDEAHDLAESGS